jgi:hypothetical protein
MDIDVSVHPGFWNPDEDDSCLCLHGPSLMNEDYYPEALALTPPPDIMSASGNQESVLADLFESAKATWIQLPSLGYQDGAGWPCSMFDAGQTPVFAGTTHDLSSDKHWILYGKAFLDSYQSEMQIALKTINQHIDDNATTIDWSGRGQIISEKFAFALRQASSTFAGVSENTMYNIISGLETDIRTLLAAEGQMIRCLLSVSDHAGRSTFFALWCVCILRLRGASLLESALQVFRCIASMVEDFDCGVGHTMQEAYFRLSNSNRDLGLRWDMLMSEVFKIRGDLLEGTQYDVKVCGFHPPYECPSVGVGSVIPDVGVRCAVERSQWASSPVPSSSSSCTLSDDNESEDDEAELPLAKTPASLARRPLMDVKVTSVRRNGNVVEIADSVPSSPVLYR